MTIAEAVRLLTPPSSKFSDPLRLMHYVCVSAGMWQVAMSAKANRSLFDAGVEVVVADTAELFRACEECCADKPETERGE